MDEVYIEVLPAACQLESSNRAGAPASAVLLCQTLLSTDSMSADAEQMRTMYTLCYFSIHPNVFGASILLKLVAYFENR